MKKFILNLMMVAYCNATAFAQQKVMLSGVSNSFRIGDSIRYDLVDIDNIYDISLNELVWDFSNLKYLGQEKAVCFIGGETGNFKTPNQNSEKPGAKGFDYDTWWQIIYKFFQ
mgnify:FL=1